MFSIQYEGAQRRMSACMHKECGHTPAVPEQQLVTQMYTHTYTRTAYGNNP